ncbi:MAG: FAD-dependent oxidoreductase [Bacteroidota bacterium]
MRYLIFFLSFLVFSCQQTTTESETNDYDICIYGGSSAGVIAAHTAEKLGKSVLLISSDKHLGGLSASGLGATDIGNKYAVTGLARDFYRRLGDHYGKLESWTFEPHVAEQLFNQYIDNADVEVWYNYRLQDATKEGTVLQQITVENAADGSTKTVSAKQFIDASYVGDLLAKADVSYTVGRESNELYGETINGVQLREYHQFPPFKNEPHYVDPYVIEGDSTSGLCYGISDEELAPDGTGDEKLQAYNYRLCITQNVDNQVPFARPENYDSTNYELLRRLILQREELGWEQKLNYFYLSIIAMPNGKTDINNKGAFSTDFIGMNYDYPEASYERRAEIEEEHRAYIEGLFYFLSHEPSLPDDLRNEMLSWGWSKDEFTDNGHFPWKMYIREARRMVGEYVMTEHNCLGDEVVDDPIGLAAYTMDSHNCQRVVVRRDGKAMVKNEGDVQVGGFPPYPIAYSSLTPKREECTNLLVPVCLSASHIAYGSIRMEPVFMVMGQVTATAAAMAIDGETSVQTIDVSALQNALSTKPYLDGRLADILIDNEDQELVTVGDWGTLKGGFNLKQNKININYTKDDVADKSIRFELPELTEGEYDLYYYVPNIRKEITWSETAKMRLYDSEGTPTEETVSLVDQAQSWVRVTNVDFSQNPIEAVEIVTQGGGNYIPADAFLLLDAKKVEL